MTQMTAPSPGRDAAAPRPFTPGAGQAQVPSADLTRIRYGAGLIAAAFILVGTVFGVAISQFTAASDVVAVVGSMTTLIGTLVGAFFGAHVGSAGKEAAEAGRTRAERTTRMALGKLDPQAAEDLMKVL